MTQMGALDGSRCEAGGCDVCAALADGVAPAVMAHGLPLELGALASVAGVDVATARAHAGGDPHALAVVAYRRSIGGLLDGFEDAFATAATWPDGLRAAIGDNLATMARQPAIAWFHLAMVRHCERETLVVREASRQRTVAILARAHARLCPGEEPPPGLQFELLAGSIAREIGAIIEEGDLHAPHDELVERVMGALRVFEPAL